MESLHAEGYTVLKTFTTISRATFDYFYELSGSAEPIFNDNPEYHRNDSLRRQYDLKPSLTQGVFIAKLKRQLTAVFPNHIAKDWVLLQSSPGCRQQAAHTDYIPTPELKRASDSTIPLLCIIALQDNTTLEVWPRTHRLRRYPILQRTITLSAGDALIFRGDLVHAGSAYSAENIRLHVYLDHPSVPRDPNRTWIIYKHADEECQKIIDESKDS